MTHAIYGRPPAVFAPPAGAIQTSPLIPGSTDLAGFAPGELEAATLLAPPGAVERRHVLALALRALKVGGRLDVMAPKDKGGSRLRKELEGFGLTVADSAKAHHRRCVAERPAALTGIDEAIAEGGLQLVEAMGLWSQPGVFSWNRIDPGSRLLVEHLPPMKGAGADLGCGVGYLGKAVLQSAAVTGLTLIDTDRRAIAAARRNIDDPRAAFVQADVRQAVLEGLDFIVTNPPFHDAGTEDRGLGQSFIGRAAGMLGKGGVLWLVANRHLPYEAPLKAAFKAVRVVAEAGGYKLFEARK